MNTNLTRNNHYVPVWYQKGFLAPGELQLYYLDLQPDEKKLPGGRIVPGRSFSRLSPKSCFCTLDLYTTQFGSTLNDEVERYLFGAIDNEGATAVRAFIGGDHPAMHKSFQTFFEYLDAQKLRTPKGLDWIKSRYPALSQLDLMLEMQGLRLMHCTMWTEAVREIVSAEASDVKFIVSDHPITVYNAAFSPDSASCAYPSDPSIELMGSQTIFVLDADTCLILTHLEYAENPNGVNLTAPRTNPRFRGSSLVRTDAFIRKRKLTRDEVMAINYCLKCRARRYVAAANREWLQPERMYAGAGGRVSRRYCCRVTTCGNSVEKPMSGTGMGPHTTRMHTDGHLTLTSICGKERPSTRLRNPTLPVGVGVGSHSIVVVSAYRSRVAPHGRSMASVNAT